MLWLAVSQGSELSTVIGKLVLITRLVVLAVGREISQSEESFIFHEEMNPFCTTVIDLEMP